jgi:hypothetical protein
MTADKLNYLWSDVHEKLYGLLQETKAGRLPWYTIFTTVTLFFTYYAGKYYELVDDLKPTDSTYRLKKELLDTIRKLKPEKMTHEDYQVFRKTGTLPYKEPELESDLITSPLPCEFGIKSAGDILEEALKYKLSWQEHDNKVWKLAYGRYDLILYADDLVWPFVQVSEQGFRLGDAWVRTPGILEQITGTRPRVFLSSVTALNIMWKRACNDSAFSKEAEKEWNSYFSETLIEQVFKKLSTKQQQEFLKKHIEVNYV